jgi:hypothetical protein
MADMINNTLTCGTRLSFSTGVVLLPSQDGVAPGDAARENEDRLFTEANEANEGKIRLPA